jgi:hypothetical protein
MRHQKLFSLLASLSREEFRKFGKFLHSPYFTESEGARVFYDYLKNHYPGFEEEKMQLEAAYQRLFSQRLELKPSVKGAQAALKKQKMADDKLNHLLSDLYRMLETFLVVEEATFDAAKQKKRANNRSSNQQLQARQATVSLKDELLQKALARRLHFDQFEKHSLPLFKKLEEIPAKNSDDYWSLSQLQHWLYYHPGADKQKPKTPGFIEAMHHLDCCYILSKLRYFAELNAYKQIRQRSLPVLMMEGVIDAAGKLIETSANQPLSEQHLLIAVYLELVSLYRVDTTELRYQKARNLFIQHAPHLPFQEKRQLFTHFINLGIRLYSIDSLPISVELFALYKWSLDEGLTVVNDQITEANYLNISIMAADCGEFEWAEFFIESHRRHLDEAVAKDAYLAAKSYLHFSKAEFDQMHELLLDITQNRIPYTILIRTWLLKLYFEKFLQDKSELFVLVNHATSFERYVSLQNFEPAREQSALNFIRFTRSLAKLLQKKGKISREEKEKLLKKLTRMTYVSSRKWLEEKIVGV